MCTTCILAGNWHLLILLTSTSLPNTLHEILDLILFLPPTHAMGCPVKMSVHNSQCWEFPLPRLDTFLWQLLQLQCVALPLHGRAALWHYPLAQDWPCHSPHLHAIHKWEMESSESPSVFEASEWSEWYLGRCWKDGPYRIGGSICRPHCRSLAWWQNLSCLSWPYWSRSVYHVTKCDKLDLSSSLA